MGFAPSLSNGVQKHQLSGVLHLPSSNSTGPHSQHSLKMQQNLLISVGNIPQERGALFLQQNLWDQCYHVLVTLENQQSKLKKFIELDGCFLHSAHVTTGKLVMQFPYRKKEI